MTGQSFTAEALVEALETGTLEARPAGVTLVGMVKAGDEPGHIGFTPSGCDSWVQLPSSSIENAVHLGENVCDDHSHPVFKITLKEPTSPEGRLLASILAASSKAQQRRSPGQSPFQPRARMGGRPPGYGGVPGQVTSAEPVHVGGPGASACWDACTKLWNICQGADFDVETCRWAYDGCMGICDTIGSVETIVGRMTGAYA